MLFSHGRENLSKVAASQAAKNGSFQVFTGSTKSYHFVLNWQWHCYQYSYAMTKIHSDRIAEPNGPSIVRFGSI